MFLDSLMVTFRQTDMTRGRGAIFDIETWHEISHAIRQQGPVSSTERPKQTGRAILTPQALDDPIGCRVLHLCCATKPSRSGANRVIGKQAG